jgi:hypothetical protein
LQEQVSYIPHTVLFLQLTPELVLARQVGVLVGLVLSGTQPFPSVAQSIEAVQKPPVATDPHLAHVAAPDLLDEVGIQELGYPHSSSSEQDAPDALGAVQTDDELQ